MIIISPSLVLSGDEAAFAAGNPVIGWHNLVTTSNVTATTEESGYPATNIANPATHLLWRASLNTGDEYLTVVTSYVDDIDYLAVARHNFGSASIAVSVEGCDALGDSPQVWTELIAPVIPADDSPLIFRFTPVTLQGIRLRMQPISQFAEVAVLYTGKLLVLERSIRVDVKHTPFNLGQVTKIPTGKSENGHFLGRIVLNSKSISTADFDHFTPDWYRENFQPFVLGAQEDPFFFAWFPTEYPLEVGYAWLADDPKPEVDPVTWRVAVQLKMEGLVV